MMCGSSPSDRDLGEDKAEPTDTSEVQVVDAFRRDKWFYRMVAGGLLLVIVLAVAGSVIAFIWTGEVPNGVTAIGSAAVGALAGVFTATARG